MADLADGETATIAGSSGVLYHLKNVGGVYSCSCPAWRNQSLPIDRRSCKHLRQFRGAEVEQARVGDSPSSTAAAATNTNRTAPPLLLAQTWTTDHDIADWWCSEKLDGVRAYWDGRQFVSRQGNRFWAPDWFCAGLPPCSLDGELWIGRQRFAETVSIVRRQDGGDVWRSVRYLVFDAPDVPGGFEERQRALTELLPAVHTSCAQILLQERCRDVSQMQAVLQRIVALGGEGMMLRQPGSAYEVGRSATLLKVKQFHDDEACVVGFRPGSGRHRGRLGALIVELPSGVRFAVGSGLTDAQRDHPPPLGTRITFRYQELTAAGVPRFPTLVRVRADEPTEQPPSPDRASLF